VHQWQTRKRKIISQSPIGAIQPALWRCFVHEGGKLEFAPNCTSNFKIFPGLIPPDPLSWGGDTNLAPHWICAILSNPLKIPPVLGCGDWCRDAETGAGMRRLVQGCGDWCRDVETGAGMRRLVQGCRDRCRDAQTGAGMRRLVQAAKCGIQWKLILTSQMI